MSVIFFIIFVKIKSDIRDNILTTNMDNALVLSKSLDLFFEELEEDMLLIAELEPVKRFNFEDTDALLQKVVLANSAISQMYLMDGQGMQFYKTSHLDTLGDRSDRMYFQKSIEGEVYVSDVVISRSTGQPITIISVPIYNDNSEKLGVLGATIDLTTIAGFIEASDKGEDGYSYIVDHKGHIIFHPNPAYVKEMLDISYLEPIQKVISGETGIGEYTFMGEEKLIAYVNIEATGWGVAVQVPVVAAYKDIVKIRQWFYGMALIAASALIVLNIFLSNFYMKPIKEIVREMKLVKADRNHSLQWGDREDEYGLIHEAFSELMDELNEMHNSLEDMIKDRTIALTEVNEELSASNLSLQETLEQLQMTQDKLIESKKLSALSRVSIRIAHELGTPLGNAITTISYIAKETEKLQAGLQGHHSNNQAFDDYVSVVKKSSDLLEHQISKSIDIMGYIKELPTAYHLQSRKRVNIAEELSAAIKVIKENEVCPNHQIIEKCPQNLEIMGWDGTIKEIFERLLENSLKHGCLVGRQLVIEINVILEEGYLKIDYKDNGRGMNPNEADYIFEPFYKGNMNSDSAGMGLTRIYNVVHLVMSGEVEFQTGYDVGVSVTIKIPEQ